MANEDLIYRITRAVYERFGQSDAGAGQGPGGWLADGRGGHQLNLGDDQQTALDGAFANPQSTGPQLLAAMQTGLNASINSSGFERNAIQTALNQIH